MEDKEIQDLIQRYLEGNCSEREEALLESWYLEQSTAFERPDEEIIERNELMMRGFLQSHIGVKRPKVRRLNRVWISAAAVILVVFGFFAYQMLTTGKVKDQAAVLNADIAPGKNGATLTLANGEKILINDATVGSLARQSGVKISKTADGQIIYEVIADNSKEIQYNTLSTTRGEQTQVRLPDGSLVFLNAESSLRYPTSFAGASAREVSLIGEGYFEVAKDRAHPFMVSSGGQLVEVLGTHFNVNAYRGETSVRTTLLEGSVRVGAIDGDSRVIVPGQQASLTGGKLKVLDVEVDDVVAWKEGYIVFERETVEDVMRQVSRWYDVEVVYRNQEVKSKLLGGSMSRFVKLSQVMARVEKVGGLKMELVGKQLFIDKK